MLMKKFSLILFASLIFIGLDMFVIEPNILIVKNQKLYIPNWDKNINGFKVAVVADIHLGTKFVDIQKLEKIANKVNKTQPDLVVLAGDLDAKSITYKGYTKKDVAKTLKIFHGKFGTVAIMGNHDYDPPNVIPQIYKMAGIPLLEHEDLFIYPQKTSVRIVGFKDLWHYKSIPANVIGTKYKNTPTVVLAHNPDSFADMPKFASLTLSGHTHGGETVFPIIGSFDVPSEYGQRYRKGYIVENNKHLYVSGGVATTSRMRFLNPPEITILELYSQDQNKKICDTKPLKGIDKNYAPILIPKLRNFINKLKTNN